MHASRHRDVRLKKTRAETVIDLKPSQKEKQMTRAIVESALEALNLAREYGFETKVLLCAQDGQVHKITVYPNGDWINEDEEVLE